MQQRRKNCGHLALLLVGCIVLAACQGSPTGGGPPTATPLPSVTPTATLFATATPSLADSAYVHLVAPVVPAGLDPNLNLLSLSPDQSLLLITDSLQIQIWRLTPPIQLVKAIQFPANTPRGFGSLYWLPDSSSFVFLHGNQDYFVNRAGTMTVISQSGGFTIYPSPGNNAIAFDAYGTPNVISIDHLVNGVVQPAAAPVLTGTITLLGWYGGDVVVYANGQHIFGYNDVTGVSTALGTITDVPSFAYGLGGSSPDNTVFTFETAVSGALYAITPHGMQKLAIESDSFAWYGMHDVLYVALVGNTRQLNEVDPVAMSTQAIAAFPNTDFLYLSGQWLIYEPPGTNATLAAFSVQTNQTVTITTALAGNTWQIVPTGDGRFYLFSQMRLYLITPE